MRIAELDVFVDGRVRGEDARDDRAVHVERGRAERQQGGEVAQLASLLGEYAALGEVERAIGLLEQALRIGHEIKDPQIIRIVTAQLERLRGGGSGEKPGNG